MTKMLKAKEAAIFLNVHLETIRRLARQKEIPAFKVGKGWRFSEDALKKWADENYTRAHDSHDPHGPNDSHDPHVLVVDDEPRICKMLTKMLHPMGYRVSTAPGGAQALEIVKTETVDLILLDLLMPDMNGAETFKNIRKINEKIPVIIITGYPDSNLMAEAMAVSPIFILQKPIDKKQLTGAVSMVLPGN